MGSKVSTLLQPEEVEEIQAETGFTPNQIYRLYSRFTRLDKNGNGYLCKEDFFRIPELAINPLSERIVYAFFSDQGLDDDQINFRQFTRVLARFLPVNAKDGNRNKLNNKTDKLKFAFRMYDLDGDNKISRDELINILHMMVGANISEDQLGSIADRTLVEADCNEDGSICFDEFVKIMSKVDVEQKMSLKFLD
ncbi:hypothetical protein HELRODRAFT_81905 [Helobdella robusta]|uniref:EF-hand domain-containing protein n=1 Tax=Helobdella robusta TaxID=6412 RepID=T1G4K6_HELRO|nr:hypothetical protein HELRODRAFT_81905 [Helobdella robusta]ESO01315.1 hypothetical protein HELRODRAFT_81905 [Helobdella robusta]